MRPAALLPLILLFGCGEDPPPETAVRSRPAAAVSAPAGPVTTFDGRYTGTVVLNPDRSGECPRLPAQPREVVVEAGRATFRLNPEVGQVQAGAVSADGAVRMTDPLDRTIATTGQFVDGTFVGTYRNNRCSYSLRMRKG